MKKSFLLALGLFAAFALTASAAAEKQLVQFKAGTIDMTVLASDGVTPLADASVKLLSPEDAALVAEAVADKAGHAAVALDEGRYLLNVSDVTLAVMEVSEEATVTSARVVVPAASMLVAGQEAQAQEGEEKAGGAAWVVPAGIAVGAAAILVPAGFIIHNNTQGHHHGDDSAAEATTTTTTRKKSKSPSAI